MAVQFAAEQVSSLRWNGCPICVESAQQGEIKLLRRQLARRFGPLPSWADERLEQASEAELEGWADRVLECRSLEDVFGGSA
jgi:hypothetical protein